MVKRTEIEIIENIKEIFECDFCGEQHNHSMSQCEVCGKDYCSDCGMTSWDEEEFPHKFCNLHYDKYLIYCIQKMELEFEHTKEMDDLYKEIMGID